MKKLHMITSTGMTGVAIAAAIVSPALACHPVGAISKSVQDVSQNSQYVAADTSAQALSVKTGDILNYRVVIANNGDTSNNDNQMQNTIVTDNLPAGVELTSNSSQRSINETVGTILPGKSITKTYQVKVTSTTDGDVITNKACFSGKSVDNKIFPQGCDTAVIKVTVPPAVCSLDHKLLASDQNCVACQYNQQILAGDDKCTAPVAPVTPTTPTPMPAPAPQPAPAALPNTGASDLIVPAALLTSLAGYAAYVLRIKRVNA